MDGEVAAESIVYGDPDGDTFSWEQAVRDRNGRRGAPPPGTLREASVRNYGSWQEKVIGGGGACVLGVLGQRDELGTIWRPLPDVTPLAGHDLVP